MPNEGVDWYQISKLHPDSLNLHKLHSIVDNVQVAHGIERVTMQYRKRLLLLFQSASRIMKKDGADLQAEHSALEMKRSIVADKLEGMEQQVEGSFKQLSNMKFILEEKKRLLHKLRERAARKHKAHAKKYFCCTLCDRQDFQSVQKLKEHMDREHLPGKTGQGKGSEVGELKDLIMTMKDKEIEMMSMFLRASREMQTQKLQDDYKNEYKKYMQVSGAKTEESKQEQVEELKASSQFLFFQKSEPFRREMQRDEQFRAQVAKNKEKSVFQREFFQSNNYYNVFGNMEENVSGNIEQQRTITQQSHDKESQQQNYDPSQFISKFIKDHSLSRQSKLTLVENGTPTPIRQTHNTKLVQKQADMISPSISDRLHQINRQKDRKNESMFSTKRKFYEDNDFVFNCGPLTDDRGGDSDYEDYFGKNLAYSQSVEDEEIKLQSVKGSAHLVNSSKESINFSKLLSPNSFMDKSEKSKDSVIVDLSDSFSRREVELSKDETINLSDLRLSKLERRKEEERAQAKLKTNAEQRNNAESHSGKGDFAMEEMRTDDKKQFDFLKEFQRQKIAPLKQQNYRFQQPSYPTNAFAKPSSNRINPVQARTGILQEFLRKEVAITALHPKESVNQALLDQFIAR